MAEKKAILVLADALDLNASGEALDALRKKAALLPGADCAGLADLAEKLAPLVRQGGCGAFDQCERLLTAYRCAVERLVEAPFGSLRLVETAFLRDTARELGVDFSGGANDETLDCSDSDCNDDAVDGGGAG